MPIVGEDQHAVGEAMHRVAATAITAGCPVVL